MVHNYKELQEGNENDYVKLTNDRKVFIIDRLNPISLTFENNSLKEYKIYGLAKSYMKNFEKKDVLIIYNILLNNYNEYIIACIEAI